MKLVNIIKPSNGLLWSIFYILIDQLSKSFFINYLSTIPDYRYKVCSYLDFIYVWNYGISFGAFSQYNFSNLIFSIINILIVMYIIFINIKANNFLQNFGYNLIIGGALGNLFDRVFRGGVFDFIAIHYNDYYFPVFNIADSFISLGVFIVMIEVVIAEKEVKN